MRRAIGISTIVMLLIGCGTTGVENKELNIEAVNAEQEKMLKDIRHEEVNENQYKEYINKHLAEVGGSADEI